MSDPQSTLVIRSWIDRLRAGDPSARDHLLACAFWRPPSREVIARPASSPAGGARFFPAAPPRDPGVCIRDIKRYRWSEKEGLTGNREVREYADRQICS
jgi:hypothetical protein